MREVTRIRMEQAKLDPAKKGGRPRKPRPEDYASLTPEQYAAKLDALEPMALFVLEQQLHSENESIRQRAALALLERKRGKPGQTQQEQEKPVTRIIYEAAAWRPHAEA